jgi:hypothetical protein
VKTATLTSNESERFEAILRCVRGMKRKQAASALILTAYQLLQTETDPVAVFHEVTKQVMTVHKLGTAAHKNPS